MHPQQADLYATPFQSANKSHNTLTITSYSSQSTQNQIVFNFANKGNCNNDRERRFKHSRPETKDGVRVFYRKNSSGWIGKLSSRETTHRSSFQPMSEMEIQRIKLVIQKLRKILLQRQLCSFLEKIKLSSSNRSTERIVSYRAKQDASRMKKKPNVAALSVLCFPLLSFKVNELKVMFLTKLRMNYLSRRIRPYQTTIIFLLIRLEARQQFLHLQLAIRLLKENH